MNAKEQNKMDVIVIEGQIIYLDPNDEGAMEKLREANKWGLGPIVKEDPVDETQRKSAGKRERGGVQKAKPNRSGTV